MNVIWIGPSCAVCGVAGTTTLWLHGLNQIPEVNLRWLTNWPPSPDAPLVDSLVDGIPTFRCFHRPSRVRTPEPNEYLDVLNAEPALQKCGKGDLLVVDYSPSVIPVGDAIFFLAAAKLQGLTRAVRVHSQGLQGLLPTSADWWVGPRPYEEMVDFDDGLPGGHLRDVKPSTYVHLPHPCGVAPTPSPAVDHGLVMGMGSKSRVDPAGERAARLLGLRYGQISFGAMPWLPIAELTAQAARGAAVMLWYEPILGVGQSATLGIAIASGRPVVVSNCEFLRDAFPWCPEREDPAKALEATLGKDPDPRQVEYQELHSTRASAVALLSRVM